ncbi:MAG: acyl-CoA thioesterase [Planctomycetes bacterium]|nr:acyl-CoA thioesterase [Planctomycetota bacterium]
MNQPHDPLKALGYHSVIRLPVQWGDQDAFGHVNNTVSIRWFESSRIAYFEHSGINPLLAAAGLGPILAAVRCDYRRQVRYPDTSWIGAKITKLGNTSLTMAHAVWSERQDAVSAEGDSVIVMFDYAANAPRSIPDDVRAAIRAFEQGAV